MHKLHIPTYPPPLHNVSAEIYHVPSERVGPQTGAQDISTPPSEWVSRDISYAFRMGWLRYNHMPSEWVGQDISIPLHSGLAEIYHIPSERVSRDISIPLHSGSAEIYQLFLSIYQLQD